MLVTSYYLKEHVKESGPLPSLRNVDLSNEPSAELHLLVKLDMGAGAGAGADVGGNAGGAAAPVGTTTATATACTGGSDEAQSDNIIVLLLIKNFRRPVEDNPMMAGQYEQYQPGRPTWTEVHRARVLDVNDFTNLQYSLSSDKDYELQVVFHRDVLRSGLREKICHANVRLRDIVHHSGTELEVPAFFPDPDVVSGGVESDTGGGVGGGGDFARADGDTERGTVGITGSGGGGKVSFRLCYLQQLQNRLMLELKVRVERARLWPFKSANPFFLVYTRDSDGQWASIYRSEVIQQNSARCGVGGLMHFAPVILPNTILRVTDDTGVRIEFFHYKATGFGILLGYIQTTAVSLRQAIPNESLPLVVNDFPHSELYGRTVLAAKKITATTTFYSIRADFGGGEMGRCVCFDVLVLTSANMKMKANGMNGMNKMIGKNKNSRKNKYVFTVHRGPKDELMYTSEVPRSTGLGMQFNEAVISLKRLCSIAGDDMQVKLRLHKRSMLRATELVGAVEMSVAEWLALSTNQSIPVSGLDTARMRIRNVQNNQGAMTKISLTFDLGAGSSVKGPP